MTKKDGDRLRAMQAELDEMASQYDPECDLVLDLARIRLAIEATLRARAFRVVQLPPPRVPFFTRPGIESSATKSPDLPPAA